MHKEDRLSTPVCLVVDPTMSGLNMILAKGENRIGYLVDIILRNRAMEYAWSLDIAKLYNQLHLEKAALPYSLFLYSDDLNPACPPMTFVMRRAWYGVVPAGNQAGYALELIVETTAGEFPAAVEPLTHHRYVDMLGYRWNPKEDFLSPGLGELNINEKKRARSSPGKMLKHCLPESSSPGSLSP